MWPHPGTNAICSALKTQPLEVSCSREAAAIVVLRCCLKARRLHCARAKYYWGVFTLTCRAGRFTSCESATNARRTRRVSWCAIGFLSKRKLISTLALPPMQSCMWNERRFIYKAPLNGLAALGLESRDPKIEQQHAAFPRQSLFYQRDHWRLFLCGQKTAWLPPLASVKAPQSSAQYSTRSS